MAVTKGKCFIIMPITTPEQYLSDYKNDKTHFNHVLDSLFTPAVKNAGFDPIPPTAKGSDIIQAEIIKHLANDELVLCDMSVLNPNVFFEFGIRTALNKPVALVIDNKTTPIPFDTGIVNCHTYESDLYAWSIQNEIEKLTQHIITAFDKTPKYNALWKYFGIAQTGVFKPEEASIGEKFDLLIKEIEAIKNTLQSTVAKPLSYEKGALAAALAGVQKDEREREMRRQAILNVLSKSGALEL